MKNEMKLQFSAVSQNESFARVTVAAFAAQLDPTVEQLTDIKTVVSEAVTNAIIHGYEGRADGQVVVMASIENQTLTLVIEDQGIGIVDLDEARQPLFTSKPEMERSGMGFTIMENFMDEIVVVSEVGNGTRIQMVKTIMPHSASVN